MSIIECKFHGEEGRNCNVKVTLYINSRYKDVWQQWEKRKDKSIKMDRRGVVTNTRFTEDAHEIKLFGKYLPVKAKVAHLENLSAHADQFELLDWLKDIKNFPEKIFLIHGESQALDTPRVKIRDTLGWQVHIPVIFEKVELIIS